MKSTLSTSFPLAARKYPYLGKYGNDGHAIVVLFTGGSKGFVVWSESTAYDLGMHNTWDEKAFDPLPLRHVIELQNT